MKLKSLILTLWVQIRDLYLYIFRHAIIVNGYVDDYTWRGIRHRNWGDDLNYYFLKELTKKPVVFYHNFKLAKWLHLMNIMCIGTILDNYVTPCNKRTIVWGSGSVGIMWHREVFSIPNKICSVRGLLTRDFLVKNGIECPECYGDPALLLPLVYQPRRGVQCSIAASSVQEVQKASYRLGIIPHVVDLHHPLIEEIREKYADEILIIDLANYKKWTDVIDQICSCEHILSSSLHGLIVSDAYQVPNCWIEMSSNIPGGHFKYLDYASSVNRSFEKPFCIEKYTDVADMVDHSDSYFSCAYSEKIKELQQGLIKVAPFKLKIPHRSNYHDLIV